MIRAARADEAETLLAIQRGACVAAFAHIFPPELYPFPDDLIRTAWEAALADSEVEVFVAEGAGEPIGSVSVGGDFLRTLYVLPTRWRTGVGTALHDHALERLLARGCARAKLWTLEENWNARRYYEKRDWALTEETRVVPFEPNPIDVQYEKKL
ncbi:MAG TPA: GNAT family N-acetyltransferase [Gaiellaceae bacterium]